MVRRLLRRARFAQRSFAQFPAAPAIPPRPSRAATRRPAHLVLPLAAPPIPPADTVAAKPLAEALPAYVDFLRRQHVRGLPCRCGKTTPKRPMLSAGYAVRQLVSGIQSSTAPVLPSLACECGLQVCCCCGTSTAAADAAAHAHACALKTHFCVAVCVESMRQIRLNIGVAKGPAEPPKPPKPAVAPPAHEWQCQVSACQWHHRGAASYTLGGLTALLTAVPPLAFPPVPAGLHELQRAGRQPHLQRLRY